ncbi:McrC family protein [Acetivibrio clariflavus]|uniref:McrBC 5-methylcytosine restriction system component n=1 Tax=Acetivibrio clariflavus (strain DSM 19732 / NBRC 101661 / EBR45) TaxID=720554 RepID=G8M0X1_ACECE|nr:restriction endonuclease [Acetivibrio clariflavus]AEV70214.1 McrBC 5-methylcytosine restriction system component [Acetivibrio clariflavus DSM 19732]
MANTINLKEWSIIFEEGAELSDVDARNTAQALKEKGIIEITEQKNGIFVESNSYVGSIKIGNIQINVSPKIEGIPLYTLLRYAYGLRDLKLFNISEHSIGNFSFFDLLIYELYAEAEDLLRRGIHKSYEKKEEDLFSPRGKIDMNRLCTQGGLSKNKLPCRYFNREGNNVLNRTLLAGLKLGLKLVVDIELKAKLQRLCSIMEEEVDDIILTRGNLQLAKNSINRLNDRYSAVLEVINILYESQGIQLEDESRCINLRGYFFDMNAFFEKLVGKLLKDCVKEYVVKDQFSLHDMFMYTPGFNPRRRESPTPRPDFALLQGGKVEKLLDTKYRDLWENNLTRDMLYQLAIYAVSGIGDKTATIIYPAVSDEPTVQKIDVKNPVTNTKMASIILKPINLVKVAGLLSKDRNELVEYVREIID